MYQSIDNGQLLWKKPQGLRVPNGTRTRISANIVISSKNSRTLTISMLEQESDMQKNHVASGEHT